MPAIATKQEILQRIQAHRDEIRALGGVEGLGLFGSFVREEQGPKSDVDLLVRFRPKEKPSTTSWDGVPSGRYPIAAGGVRDDGGLSPYSGPHISKRSRMLLSTSSMLVSWRQGQGFKSEMRDREAQWPSPPKL